MAGGWELELAVDASGWSAPVIRARHPAQMPPHLVVGAGPVLVYALDADSVGDLASAWAAAHVRGTGLLPRTGPPRPAPGGTAFPAGQLVLDGRQPWRVSPPGVGQPHLVLTAGGLTVRVHDQAALDSQVRVWTQASAVGTRIFGRQLPPFNELVRQAEFARFRDPREPRRRGADRTRGGR